MSEEDWEVIARTASAPPAREWAAQAELRELQELAAQAGALEFLEEQAVQPTFRIEGDALDDMSALIAEAAAAAPELDHIERHGDLTIFKAEAQAAPWYQLAGEESLPAALRGVKGPIDVKVLLQALIVEVGDVKRTNAILMEALSRLEEKVDRTNRLLRDRPRP
jgi:hypothetical protein